MMIMMMMRNLKSNQKAGREISNFSGKRTRRAQQRQATVRRRRRSRPQRRRRKKSHPSRPFLERPCQVTTHRLSYCKIVWLSDCHTVRLTNCQENLEDVSIISTPQGETRSHQNVMRRRRRNGNDTSLPVQKVSRTLTGTLCSILVASQY